MYREWREKWIKGGMKPHPEWLFIEIKRAAS
jgi:hypothetical protein